MADLARSIGVSSHAIAGDLDVLEGASVVRRLFFWRTQAGAEVDLLIESGRRLLPVEIKLGASVDPRSLAGLRQCLQDLGAKRGVAVYPGDERRDAGRGIELLPWDELVSGAVSLL